MKYTVNHLFAKFTLPVKCFKWLMRERTKLKVWSSQKGEITAFWNFLLTRRLFLCKGSLWSSRPALSRAWVLCYNRWPVHRSSHLNLVVEIRNPCPAQIFIFNCKGGSSNGGLKPMTSHDRWYDQTNWAALGHGEKLLFFFFLGSMSRTWVGLGFHHLHAN